MQIISKISTSESINRYQPGDEKLFISKTIQRSFGTIEDYVEYHVYDINANLLASNYDFKAYKPSTLDKINSDGTLKTIELDPGQDLINQGYREGDLSIQYNFFRKKIFNEIGPNFFIKEISPDKTEIRVASNIINNDDLEKQINLLINEISNTQYYKDYILNFGENKCIVAINVALDKNDNHYTVLFKLYEPLPQNINIKDTFWVVDEIIQSPIYNVDLFNYIQNVLLPTLRPANFDINIDNTENSSLNYNSYNDLLTTSSFSSSYNQVLNILNQKGININVDYSEYTNFINFSSVTERLENFKYKLQLIETYNSQSYVLDNILTSSNYVTQNKEVLRNKIDGIISKFDGYEYFLYFESGSKTWPKNTSSKPWINIPTTSSYAITWFDTELTSASYYDQENINNLEYTVPEFIREDEQNTSYLLFLNMIGQHFDNIWIFINSITDINKGDSKLTEGISKDLIVDVLKSLGVKLYSSNSNINLFEYLIGSNSRGTYTYVYGEPTGSYFTNVITASNETLPKEDINKEVLKRIYHNLPLLLKSKGTVRGLRTLINCYGIPDTILRINEFGGSDKTITTPETIFNRYFYSTYLTGSGKIQIPWDNLKSSNSKPLSTEFRFKPFTSSLYPTQSLFSFNNVKFEIYPSTGSHGTLTYKLNNVLTTSISLPFYNGDWWNFMLFRNNTTYSIYLRTKDRNAINFNEQISWTNSNPGFYTGSSTASFGGSGSIHYSEIRYWSEILSSNIFNKHVLNPESYEGNNITSSYYTLAFRAPLGNNLITNSFVSIHPNQNIVSFATSSTYILITSASYIPNEEVYYLNSPGDSFVRTNDKFRIQNNSIYGVTSSVDLTLPQILSPYVRLEQLSGSNISSDLHFVEVGFAPTNEINNDIINELGGFNLDNYIGDPAELYSGSYESLETLKKFYFQKYLRSYNYSDYIRLIKFFDNSLFRFIKDFIPSRSNLLTGITIESNILEKNKIKHSLPKFEEVEVEDIDIQGPTISNDNSYLYDKLPGDKKPFYTGELSGSILNINNYFSLNPYKSKTVLAEGDTYDYYVNIFDRNDFLHSDWNVLLNNVTGSRMSFIKRKLDLYPSIIEYKAELQDSYDDLLSHERPRHSGVKVYSTLYNTYTEGDKSFGKNAVIDKYVKKVGLFAETVTSSFFNRYSNIHLKYLIDESGSLTELNIKNRNWCEIQNTFLNGDNLWISLFNNQKLSNQKRTDGRKGIFESGYSYYPLFYHISGSGEEAVFEYTELSGSNLFKVLIASGTIEPKINSSYPNIFNTGSYTSSVSYGGKGKIIPTIFNFTGQSGEYNDGGYYNNGVQPTPSTASYYIIPRDGVYSFTWDFTLKLTLDSAPSLPTSSLYEIRITDTSGSVIGSEIFDTTGFTSTAIGANKLYVDTNHPIFHKNLEQAGVVTLTGTTQEYTMNVLTNTFNTNLVLDKYSVGRRWYSNHYTAYYVHDWGPDSTRYIGYEDNSGGGFSYQYNFNGTAITSMTSGSIIKFEFFVSGSQDYTSSILPGGYLRADPGSGGTPNITDPFLEFNTTDNYIDIVGELAGFINNELYIFNPNPSGSVSNLHYKYGDIDYSFVLSLYDRIVLSNNNGTSYYNFSIISMSAISSTRFRIYVSPSLPSNIGQDLYEILFLKRVNDETNIIIKFLKPPGKTSYGIVIPNNLHPDVLKNIDFITKEAKLKLIDDGINVIDIDGGTF